MQMVKTDQAGGCPGWSESSLGTHAILKVLSYAGSYVKKQLIGWQTVEHDKLLFKFLFNNTLCCLPDKERKGTEGLTEEIEVDERKSPPSTLSPWIEATFYGVWSGSTLFTQTCLSKYVGHISYIHIITVVTWSGRRYHVQ